MITLSKSNRQKGGQMELGMELDLKRPLYSKTICAIGDPKGKDLKRGLRRAKRSVPFLNL